jgi:hypothetical protein
MPQRLMCRKTWLSPVKMQSFYSKLSENSSFSNYFLSTFSVSLNPPPNVVDKLFFGGGEGEGRYLGLNSGPLTCEALESLCHPNVDKHFYLISILQVAQKR